MTKAIVGYMCTTDWDHELGEVSYTKVYSSVAALKEACKCWAECGITEVVTTFKSSITESDHKLLRIKFIKMKQKGSNNG